MPRVPPAGVKWAKSSATNSPRRNVWPRTSRLIDDPSGLGQGVHRRRERGPPSAVRLANAHPVTRTSRQGTFLSRGNSLAWRSCLQDIQVPVPQVNQQTASGFFSSSNDERLL